MATTEEVAAPTEEEQLVVFELARESYGVNIGAVNTIIRMQQITRVPRTPDFVEGVINLRGSIVPVIDLRERFEMGTYEETKASRIVVVETSAGLIGLIVDAVTETLSLAAEAIEPPSSLVTTSDSHYLRGVGKVDDRLIILLGIEQLLSVQEAEALMEAAPSFCAGGPPAEMPGPGPEEAAAGTSSGNPERAEERPPSQEPRADACADARRGRRRAIGGRRGAGADSRPR